MNVGDRVRVRWFTTMDTVFGNIAEITDSPFSGVAYRVMIDTPADFHIDYRWCKPDELEPVDA